MVQESQLNNLKGIVSAYDHALFLWYDATGNLIGLLAMHVDYILFWENYTFQRNVISELKRMFKVGTHENETFKFWGLVLSIYYRPKSLCFISISNRHKEKKVLKNK